MESDDRSRRQRNERSGSWRSHDGPAPIFAHCAIQLDSDGVIRDANSSEIFECCTKRCEPKFAYCKDMCEEYLNQIFTNDLLESELTEQESFGRCMSNCRIMRNLCAQECRGLSPGFTLHNDYYDCAAENGCPPKIGQLPDKRCVEKNKDVIFNCCRSACIPTSVVDCQDHCTTLQASVLDPASLGLPATMYPYAASQLKGARWPGEPILDEKEEKGSNKTNDNNNLLPYLGVAVGIGLVISLCIGTGLYWYRSKRK